MSEISAETIRKNNISAYLFLATAILSAILLAFLCFVFILIFGSIQAIFTGLGGTNESAFSASDVWQLYVAFFLCVAVIISQLAAFALIKTRQPYGRIAGIVSFALTLLMFTPLSILLIYTFAFLLSNDGKYIYQKLYRK